MRTCFVSIPFGRKPLPDGQEIDFDFLYQVIKPAVEELEIECRRLDEYSPGAILHKTLLAALISSDLVIADISTANANIFYELGIRHALKRGRTILIAGGGRIPWDINYIQTLRYQPDGSGRISDSGVAQFRAELQGVLKQSKQTSVSDSPIYEFFPDLEVLLPSELEVSPRRRRPRLAKARGGFANTVVESPAQVKGALEEREAEVRSAPEADPSEYLILLRRYRDLSEWDKVIALAEDAPPTIAQSPEVVQMLALALNRRGESGDQDRAITLMEQQVAETGGDSESFGVLGRIYKDRYDNARIDGDSEEAAKNLELALDSYRKGFEKNPRDYYPGINVVNLLLQRGDAAARAELDAIVPRVRAVVQEKLETDRPDFWDLATDLQLAVIARDWTRAEETAKRAAMLAPSAWMLETTARDMRLFTETLTDGADRDRMHVILDLLSTSEIRIQGVADA